MRMMRILFPISILLVLVFSHVEIIDPDSLDWITTDGEKRPILRIVINGETILLPLREAPFCRLADTRECECYILRKDSDSSDWEVASFVKCGHEVRGNFFNTRYQFGITPKKGSQSWQHIVEKYKPENDSTMETTGELSEEEQEEETDEDAELSYGFLKPLPEYGELFENETGYITIKFVLSKLFFNHTPESRIDHTLQNHINAVNHYLGNLNLLAIYEGWTQALEPETNLTTLEVIRAFYLRRYRNYDEENTINAVILIGESQASRVSAFPGGICSGPSGIFVRDLNKTEYSIELLWRLLYGLGRNMGLSRINRTVCDPGEDYRWIMEPDPKEPNASMKWSNCSKEEMQKEVKKHLACLKRKIEPKKPRCGNGWVDDGEECDCVTQECQRCCDNCRLTAGSKCYNGPCCNKVTCMFMDSGTQCRAADDSCDIPELCDGKSSECPPDFVVSNGYKCQESPHKSYCFRGKCGSRMDMCGGTFQNSTVASDTCYKLNTENGRKYGGCGPTFQSFWAQNMSYYACKGPDMYCGKVFCHVEGDLVYTPELSRYRRVLLGLSITKDMDNCTYMQLNIFYKFLREDPTFVPNGSECAPDHMCVKQRCTPLPKGCPQNCSGVPRIHPYTKQEFPSHEINWQLKPRESGSSLSIWIYFLVGSLIVLLVSFGIYYIYSRNSSSLSKISDEHTSRFTVSSTSRDASGRTSSVQPESQVLSDDSQSSVRRQTSQKA